MLMTGLWIAIAIVAAGFLIDLTRNSLREHRAARRNSDAMEIAAATILRPAGAPQHVFTDRDYRVQALWVLKNAWWLWALPPVFLLILIQSCLVYAPGCLPSLPSIEDLRRAVNLNTWTSSDWFILPLFAIWAFRFPVADLLSCAHFHFALQDDGIVFQQGTFFAHARSVPYRAVRKVSLTRDWFDKIFGWASLTIEDASQPEPGFWDDKMTSEGYVVGYKVYYEVIGFLGNRIHIPGLKREDAEELQAHILQKATSAVGEPRPKVLQVLTES